MQLTRKVHNKLKKSIKKLWNQNCLTKKKHQEKVETQERSEKKQVSSAKDKLN